MVDIARAFVTIIRVSHPEPPPAPPRHAPAQPGLATPERRPAGPPRWVVCLVAGLPAVLAVLLLVLIPGFMQPVFDERISLVGIPLGLVLLAVVFALSPSPSSSSGLPDRGSPWGWWRSGWWRRRSCSSS